MYTALKAGNGNVRLWIYQGLHHDSWARAYNEPELPRWLLAHRLNAKPEAPLAERIVIPPHPVPIKLTPAVLDTLIGEYHDASGHLAATLFRQSDQLYEKDPHGEVAELEAESASSFFYPNGSVWTSPAGGARWPRAASPGSRSATTATKKKWERTRTLARNP